MGWRREGRAVVQALPWQVDRLAVGVDLPVFYTVPGVTVRAVAVVLHFLIKPDTFPRPCLGTPVFVRSVRQRLPGGLVQVTGGYAADISIWNSVGSPWQASVSEKGAVGLHRVHSGQRPRGLLALHRCQPRRRRWRVGLSQDREDGRGLCWGPNERRVGLHFDLLYAGGRGATGAAVERVRLRAVRHLILQL